ncbi:MAG TPA: cellulase family glycosylhydrolase [Clostridia bacterium]|nr:cellulase family glycosylhydrolase [Clostridia bacterium]
MKEFSGYRKGINLGGWLSQCDHSRKHYDSFISESDISRISGWGLDHVRLPVDHELVRSADGSINNDGFKYIDRCLEWCENHNLNMILDLHKTAGYSFDEKVDDFFRSPKLQDSFVSLWEEFARRYGKYAARLSFELLNEVVDINVADVWNDIVKRTIAVIRKHAPVTKILVGGVRNNSVLWVSKLDAPYDENVVYTFHFYEPLIFTHQSAYWVDKMPADYSAEYPNDYDIVVKETEKYLPPMHREIYDIIRTDRADKSFIRAVFADALKAAEERNTAIYCGEYGVIDKAPLRSTLNWFSDINSVFEECGISRALWTYKGKDFGITDEHYSEILDELVKLL